MNVSSTATSTAVPLFTSSSSKTIAYEPFAVSISPTSVIVVPTGPLFGVIVVIVVGLAGIPGRNEAPTAATSSSVARAKLSFSLSKRFPSFSTFFSTCFLSLKT